MLLPRIDALLGERGAGGVGELGPVGLDLLFLEGLQHPGQHHVGWIDALGQRAFHLRGEGLELFIEMLGPRGADAGFQVIGVVHRLLEVLDQALQLAGVGVQQPALGLLLQVLQLGAAAAGRLAWTGVVSLGVGAMG